MSDDFRIVPASARWLLIIGGIVLKSAQKG